MSGIRHADTYGVVSFSFLYHAALLFWWVPHWWDGWGVGVEDVTVRRRHGFLFIPVSTLMRLASTLVSSHGVRTDEDLVPPSQIIPATTSWDGVRLAALGGASWLLQYASTSTAGGSRSTGNLQRRVLHLLVCVSFSIRFVVLCNMQIHCNSINEIPFHSGGEMYIIYIWWVRKLSSSHDMRGVGYTAYEMVTFSTVFQFSLYINTIGNQQAGVVGNLFALQHPLCIWNRSFVTNVFLFFLQYRFGNRMIVTKDH